jgi:hypothetical protein
MRGRRARWVERLSRAGASRPAQPHTRNASPPPHLVRLGLDLGQQLAQQGLLVLLKVDVLCCFCVLRPVATDRNAVVRRESGAKNPWGAGQRPPLFPSLRSAPVGQVLGLYHTRSRPPSVTQDGAARARFFSSSLPPCTFFHFAPRPPFRAGRTPCPSPRTGRSRPTRRPGAGPGRWRWTGRRGRAWLLKRVWKFLGGRGRIAMCERRACRDQKEKKRGQRRRRRGGLHISSLPRDACCPQFPRPHRQPCGLQPWRRS